MKRIKVKTQVVHTDDQVITYFDQLLHRLGEKWKLFSLGAVAIMLAMLLGIVVNVIAENRENEAANLLFSGVETLELGGPLGAPSSATFPSDLSKLQSDFAGKDPALIAKIYEGVYRYGRGEYNGAKMAFEEAIQGLDDQSPQFAALARYNLGMSYEGLGQWSEAKAVYETMSQQLAESGFSKVLLVEARARTLKRLGDQDGAVRALEEAMADVEEEQDRIALTNALQTVRLTFTQPLPVPEEPEAAPAEEVPAE